MRRVFWATLFFTLASGAALAFPLDLAPNGCVRWTGAHEIWGPPVQWMAADALYLPQAGLLAALDEQPLPADEPILAARRVRYLVHIVLNSSANYARFVEVLVPEPARDVDPLPCRTDDQWDRKDRFTWNTRPEERRPPNRLAFTSGRPATAANAEIRPEPDGASWAVAGLVTPIPFIGLGTVMLARTRKRWSVGSLVRSSEKRDH